MFIEGSFIESSKVYSACTEGVLINRRVSLQVASLLYILLNFGGENALRRLLSSSSHCDPALTQLFC